MCPFITSLASLSIYVANAVIPSGLACTLKNNSVQEILIRPQFDATTMLYQSYSKEHCTISWHTEKVRPFLQKQTHFRHEFRSSLRTSALQWDKVVAMGCDNASYSIPPFERSSKSWRVQTCDPPRCNLLGLQLKARVNGLYLSTSPWTPAIRSSCSSRNDVMTDGVIKCPPLCTAPTTAYSK